MNPEINLPENWENFKLREICRVVCGTTPDTSVSDYWNGDIVWITPSDLGQLNEKFITTSLRKITQSGVNSKNLEIVPLGSIVLSSRAPIGHLGIANVPLCVNQGCKIFIPNKDIIDSQFLYYCLKQNIPDIKSRGSGATFKEISKTKLEMFQVSIPELPEQRRIVQILDHNLSVVKQSISSTLMQLNATKALPFAYLKTLFESKEAQKWEFKKLGDLAETTSGLTPLRSNSDYYKDGTIPWIKSGELLDGNITDAEEFISLKALQETSLRLLPPLTLLIAMYGQGQTRGRTGLLKISATINQACFALLPNPEIFDTLFLQYWFRYNYSRLRNETEQRGGNQPNLNGQILKKQNIPLPSIQKQIEITLDLQNKLSQFIPLLEAIESQLKYINNLSNSFLHQAFNGYL